MILPQVLLSGLLLGGVYALISIGLTLIFGVVRIVNFAQGEFVMLAMFATYFLVTLVGMDPYLAGVIVVPAFFVLGLLVYSVIFRFTIGRPAVTQIFASVGLLIVLQNLALYLWGADVRTIRTPYLEAIQVAGLSIQLGLLIAFVVALGVAVGLNLVLTRTRWGVSIRAATQDRAAATLMGVDNNRVFAVVFGLGIAAAALAGVLLMPTFSVYPLVGVQLGLVSFVVVVLGGLGSVPGAILGGLLIGLVETGTGFFISTGLQQLGYFVVFILFLVFRPSGLFGLRGAEELGHA
jgi:branched-chain amino acid transport system permease protein